MKNVLVVYKKSVYELYSSSPDKTVRDFVNGDSFDAAKMRESHEAQQRTLETAVNALDAQGFTHKEVYRADLCSLSETEDIEANDMVVSVGGDGTFLEVSHYVSKVPILGVNSDGNSSVGYFCTANRHNFAETLMGIGSARRTTLSRLELKLNGVKLPEQVLNDILVAHPNPAAVTRYRITTSGEASGEASGEQKEYKSSGLLVCTAAGSTAWMYNEGGTVMPLSSTRMQYLSRGVRGEKPGFAAELAVQSLTRESCIYVDGAHNRYEFTLGSTLSVAKGKPLLVVGDLEKKREAYRS